MHLKGGKGVGNAKKMSLESFCAKIKKAMVKEKTKFVCQQCGAEAPKFLGRCPGCGAWNSLVETVERKLKGQSLGLKSCVQSSKPIRLGEVKLEKIEKVKTGISELDRVLGGGLVPGQVILLAGEPGVGKSTLLLQVAASLTGAARQSPRRQLSVQSRLGDMPRGTEAARGRLANKKDVQSSLGGPSHLPKESSCVSQRLAPVLYVSGEESVEQISLRAKRLGFGGGESKNLTLLAETKVENIVDTILKWDVRNAKWDTDVLNSRILEMGKNKKIPLQKPQDIKTSTSKTSHLSHRTSLLIIDSIQTMWTEDLTGMPGAVGQVRESARRLASVAKQAKIPLIMVGHVTKEGVIAGPKVLEHLVDTVLYLEGERFGRARLLRVAKNRFGPIEEVGVFKMREKGIFEVSNPSALFFEKRKEKMPGSALVVILEGSRPLLVELQALVSPSELKSPRRIGNGISYNRLCMINAILAKHLRLPLNRFDVYVNVASGLKVSEPAADLAIALSIYTSFKNCALPKNTVCLGELSLLGEIRPVSNFQKRVAEAKRLGFSKIFSAEKFSTLKELLKTL